MLVIILRVILFITPLLLLFLWLNWRRTKVREGADLAVEFAKLRLRLIAILLTVVVTIFGIKLTESDSGKAGTNYIPPHTKDGKIVPGSFKEKDKDGGR